MFNLTIKVFDPFFKNRVFKLQNVLSNLPSEVRASLCELCLTDTDVLDFDSFMDMEGKKSSVLKL